ncbi:hypothetical protein MRX96_043121 [Rhipicephalus microplus]
MTTSPRAAVRLPMGRKWRAGKIQVYPRSYAKRGMPRQNRRELRRVLKGNVERQSERFCVAQRPVELRKLGNKSYLRLCCPKIWSVGISLELGVEFSDAEHELRPAAACAAGTCPSSDHSADGGKQDSDRVCKNFSKHRGDVRRPT